MKEMTTTEVAEVVGIGRATLHRWIASGQVSAPQAVVRFGHSLRLWSQTDIERLRKIKEQIYRKGRGRKPNK